MEQNPLSPEQAIEYLKARYNKPLHKSYLAKLRSTGHGPVFFRIGASVFYDQIDLDRWIHHKRSPKGHLATQIAGIEAGHSPEIEEDEHACPAYEDGWIELD